VHVLLRSAVRQSLAGALAVGALGCHSSRIDASTDRVAYTIEPRDSAATVRVALRNGSGRRIYLQTADGQADVLMLVLVKSAGRDAWSLFRDFEGKPLPKMGMVHLEPDSSHTSAYRLPGGEYRILVVYGDDPRKLDEHGVWVKQFSVR
jgi:hypothetical protein